MSLFSPGLVDFGGEDLLFTCRNCGLSYKHEQTMTRHRKKCEGNYNLACQFCGKLFYRRDKLRDHVQRKHNQADIPFIRHKAPPMM